MDLIKKLRDKGISFIFVSHKIEEVFALADTVTVLRDGKNVASVETGEISARRADHAHGGADRGVHIARNEKLR